MERRRGLSAGGKRARIGRSQFAAGSRVLLAGLTLASAARAQDCQPVPSGIEAWWDADEVFVCSGLNETVARDLTGSPRQLQLKFGAGYSGIGIVGPAFELDGVDDFLQGAIGQVISTSGTVEFWMRATGPQLDLADGLSSIVDYDHTNFRNWGLHVLQATGQISWFIGDGSTWNHAVSTTNVLDGAYHHVVATYDASLPSDQQKLYIDGQLEATRTLAPGTAIPYQAGSLYVGAFAGGYRHFRGLIDELSLYTRALSAAEVQAIVAAGSAGKCRGRAHAPIQRLRGTDFGRPSGLGRVLAADGMHLVVGGPFILPGGVSCGGGVFTYEFNGTSWVPDGYFDGLTYAYELGTCVFQFGDAVDVRGERMLATAYGLAFFYDRIGGAWVRQAVVPPSYYYYSAFGGKACAIDGDLAVVGAHEEQPNGVMQGAVYVFHRSPAGIWSEELRLPPPDPGDRRFGWSLDLEGNRMLIGDPGADYLGTDSGVAYLYVRDASSGTWALEATLLPTDAGMDGGFAQDWFGASVSLRNETALVGCPGDDEAIPGDNAGAAYVFRRTPAGWSAEGKLRASDAWVADSFGGAALNNVAGPHQHGVVLSADGSMAVVGSMFDDDVACTTAWNNGAAYLFRREMRGGQPAWIEAAKFRDMYSPADYYFGHTLALASDRLLGSTYTGAQSPSSERERIDVYDLAPFALNRPPVALVGPDQVVDEGDLVTLDGSISFDPDGDALTYEWTQLAGPPVAFDATSPAPAFLAPQVTPGGVTLTFALTVSDGVNTSEPAVTNVVVRNVNVAPVADTGMDQTLSEGSPVSLDGSGSFDEDGDPLTYSWTQLTGTPVSLSDPTSAQPTFTAPLVGPGGDVLTFALTVSDGELSDTAETSVTVLNVNQAPTAVAGSDQTSNELEIVRLDGSASSDPDGDTLTYQWMQLWGPPIVLSDASVVAPAFTAPEVASGSVELAFDLTVCDPSGACSSDTVVVTVQDVNAPPDCSLAQPSVASLWPPDHKLVPITITGVSDPDGTDVTVTITGVWQDEPLDGLGSGDTSPDAVLQGDTVLLRAERSGTGNGRVYRIEFEADDGQGGVCSGSVLVRVPHSKKTVESVMDDGTVFDSTGA